jgi:splicing factor 3B subunit 3
MLFCGGSYTGYACIKRGYHVSHLIINASNAFQGDLSDTRTRYLGVRGVRLFRVVVQGNAAVLALSSRPWLAYSFQGQMRVTPLSYDSLDFASMFSSEQVCVSGSVLV